MTPFLNKRRFLQWVLLFVALVAVMAGLLHPRPAASMAAGSCVPALPHAAGDFSETVVSGGVTRSYELHVPPSYAEDEQMALVLNWHGLGGTASGQQSISGLPAKADAAGFIVAAPQGVEGFHNFASIFDEPDDVLFTNDLLDELESQLCIDTARVFSTGFSNGAQMSTRLACSASERVAAIAPVAGWYYPPFSPNFPDEPDCTSTRPAAAIAFHGTADGLIPYKGGPGVVGIPFRSFEGEIMPEWAAHNGCDAVPVQEQVTQNVRRLRHENCDEDATVELYVVEGGGHSWPGVSGGTPEISANDLMWEFFQAHPLVIGDAPTVTPPPTKMAGEEATPTATAAAIGLPTAGATEGFSRSYGLMAGVSAAAAAVGLAALAGLAWYWRRRVW